MRFPSPPFDYRAGTIHQVHVIMKAYVESAACALDSCLVFKRLLWEASLQSLFLQGRVVLIQKVYGTEVGSAWRIKH